MPAIIKKFYTERIPTAVLIGRRYTDDDRVNGSFGHKWGECFESGLFTILENMNVHSTAEHGDAYLGAMRVVDGAFEYWIGMSFPVGTPVPEGFGSVTMEALTYAVYWLYGKENSGDLFGMEAHELCLSDIKTRGLSRKEDDWCIERYNCPRFTEADGDGNVILDYLISID